MSAPTDQPPGDRLDSWKEIAAYLGREVRTVQGWEKSEGLPVHRHQHARLGSVYAFKGELDVWRAARRGSPEPAVAVEQADSGKHRPFALPKVAIGVGVLLLACLAGWLLWTTRGRPSGAPSSVAVLPFLDLSPQKDQEYFSDGLSEEIIDALSRVPNLRVVARTSAFAFKGKNVDIRQIGQQLSVATVLEGSVRKSGDQLRITAQLNRVADGYHLWSRTFDRRLSDVFAVQREISQAIANQLRAGEIPRRETTRDLEAYRLYQEGRYFFNQFQPPESNDKAIARYREAIQRDPGFALAYAGMADAYAYQAENWARPPREVMPKAKEAAQKAVDLNDSSAEAHTSLGLVKLDYDRDREGAQREFLRAMQLSPGSGWARHWYAHSLEAQNRLNEAMTEMRAALDLDPLSIPIYWDIAAELLDARRYDDALQHLKKANELFPNIPLFSSMEITAYYAKGDAASAHRAVESIKANHPELAKEQMFIGLFGTDAVRNGRRADGLSALDRLERLRQTQYVEAVMVTPLCAALKDAKCLELWLKRADEERSTLFVYLPLVKDVFGLDPAVVARYVKAP